MQDAAYEVAVFYDALCRDGRRAVEVRIAIDVGEKWFCSKKLTTYSCAYDGVVGRIAAFRRALEHVKGCKLVGFEDFSQGKAVLQ